MVAKRKPQSAAPQAGPSQGQNPQPGPSQGHKPQLHVVNPNRRKSLPPKETPSPSLAPKAVAQSKASTSVKRANTNSSINLEVKRKNLNSNSNLKAIPNIPTQNSFAVLDGGASGSMEVDPHKFGVQAPGSAPPKVHKPPPIVVDVAGMPSLTPHLRGITSAFRLRSNRTETKILCDTQQAYDVIIAKLKTIKHQYHTFSKKGDTDRKRLKFLVHGYHVGFDIEEVKRVVLSLPGVVSLDRMSKRSPTGEATPLNPLVLITTSSFDLASFQAIRVIDHVIFKVTRFNFKNSIAQCNRCQRLQHTGFYCNREHACVRCGENHPTQECTHQVNTHLRCVNCEQSHVASYKQCPARLRLLESRRQKAQATGVSVSRGQAQNPSRKPPSKPFPPPNYVWPGLPPTKFAPTATEACLVAPAPSSVASPLTPLQQAMPATSKAEASSSPFDLNSLLGLISGPPDVSALIGMIISLNNTVAELAAEVRALKNASKAANSQSQP